MKIYKNFDAHTKAMEAYWNCTSPHKQLLMEITNVNVGMGGSKTLKARIMWPFKALSNSDGECTFQASNKNKTTFMMVEIHSAKEPVSNMKQAASVIDMDD